MSISHLKITDELAAYMRQSSLREPQFLTRLRVETAKLPQGSMQITPEQGQFMALLIQILNAKRALEVGVFTGYSSTAVALALPPDGELIACDVSEEYTRIARKYWEEAKVAHKIQLRLGPAIQTLDRLISKGQAGSFDFAFVDADKENYDRYYERALILLRTGGVIAVDNVLWHGRVIDSSVTDADTEAIRRLNTKLVTDERISLSMLPIGDGLTLAVKRKMT